MIHKEAGLVIAFNGEIYNFIELRKQLIAKGHKFLSDTDTEVILAAYLEWGSDAFKRFNGMWAIALYDPRIQQLTLCRDRFGVKPLYYYFEGESLIFCSELKALIAVKDKISLDWDYSGIKTALINAFQLESTGNTILRGVKNLLPGHFLVINSNGFKISRWWDTREHLCQIPSDYSAQVESFRNLLFDAVELRMRSDVPLGSSLSGGLDSSSIVASMHHIATRRKPERLPNNWQKTFIHRFKGAKLDESVYGAAVSFAVSSDNIFVDADESSIAGDIDKILYHYETIYPGMPDSLWRVYKAQRANGIIVTLDGHGGDELLGGYDWHVAAAMKDTNPCHGDFWKYIGIKKQLHGYGLPSYFYLKAFLTGLVGFSALEAMARSTVNEKFLTHEAKEIEIYKEKSPEVPKEWSNLKKTLYRDFHERIMPRILKTYDLMSMAHGVEVRMPLLDYRLVCFCFSLPDSSLLHNGFTKLILRDAMKGLLPENVRLRRSKIGFNSPVIEWFQGPLKEWLRDIIYTDSPLYNIIDKQKLQKFFLEKIVTGKIKYDEAFRFWTHASALRLYDLLLKNH